MKKFNPIFSIITATLFVSGLHAQWSAVRFDSSNTYSRIDAVTPNDVFSIGTEPMNGEYFVLRTSDGGNTWDSIALNTGADDYQMFEIYFPDVNNGFIGGRKNNANQNMQKTIDNGNTWTDITPDPNSIETISAIYFLDGQQGWASSGRNLYLTANGGTNWTTMNLNFYPQDLHFVSPLVGYAAGGDTMTTQAYVMKTIDGGLTWNPVFSNHDQNVFVNEDNNLNFVNSNVIFTNQEWTNKIYRTQNGGATWDSIICDSAMQILDFNFTSADSGQVLTSMGQIFYTNDAGATWNLAYSVAWGFYGPSVYFYSMSFSQGTGFVCGTSGLIKRYDYSVTGVHEIQEVSGMKVYPSPCYGTQNITLETHGMQGDCSLWIMNELGEVVHYEVIQDVQSTFYHPLSSVHLAAGTYTVVLHNDTQKQTAKLVIVQ